MKELLLTIEGRQAFCFALAYVVVLIIFILAAIPPRRKYGKRIIKKYNKPEKAPVDD